jgi:hypothetical protein
MFRYVTKELRNHAPFTIFGAITGIVMMVVLYNLPFRISYNIFYVLHPIHVVLSALVTSSMYELHTRGKCKLGVVIPIGYVGSVGIATISDSVIPYLGEVLLNLPHRGIHLGFIEKYWLVNPLAFLGIAVACLRPRTKFPHAGHVLISTWASLFHVIMAAGGKMGLLLLLFIFLFLFLAVWLPCCLSDIVFPLLFVKEKA